MCASGYHSTGSLLRAEPSLVLLHKPSEGNKGLLEGHKRSYKPRGPTPYALKCRTSASKRS